MSIKYINASTLFLFLSACSSTTPSTSDRDAMTRLMRMLNAYRVEESQRCAGYSYRSSLGSKYNGNASGSIQLSDELLSKGFGTGSLDIGITIQEKTRLSQLLESKNNDALESFLDSYKSCLDDSMRVFYQVLKIEYPDLEYPEAPTSKNVIWSNETHEVESHKTAHKTECNECWRTYDICVSIPSNALMIKESVSTRVVGVSPGTWGDWKTDFRFVDNNAYGPTKVCRSFDHQMFDRDRELYLKAQYRLPK